MKTHEAWKALLEGKKVRNKLWEVDEHVFLSEDGYLFSSIEPHVQEPFNYWLTEDREDWKIYEEKKLLSWEEIEGIIKKEFGICHQTSVNLRKIKSVLGFKE